MKRAFFLWLACCLFSCSGTKNSRTDTPSSGIAFIMSDECFKPVMENELSVFTGLNPAAHIMPYYLSEDSVFKLLLSDSIRMALTARDLSQEEVTHIKKINSRTPRSQIVAIDGIALIINRANPDSVIGIPSLQKILTGKISDWNELKASTQKTRPVAVVFDQNHSSTLRFIQDSITQQQPLASCVFAASSNEQVIEYVIHHPEAMGIIGVSWISNPYDSTQLSFNEKIRVMSVSRVAQPDEENSYKPYPAYLATGNYPLTRFVYAIITDVRGGLPSGFTTFVVGNAGQRIILKSGLVPATRPTRLINLKNDF